MCVRYFIEPETEEMTDLLFRMNGSALCDKFAAAGNPVKTAGEIRPTDVVPVIASDQTGAPAVFPMKWGFGMQGRAPIVNARTETAAQKPTFRESWASHRCIIPASWYFEWEHFTDESGKRKTGQKYRINPGNASVTWLGGLYRIENGLPVFTVLTKEPSDGVRRIHDRMPVIFPQSVINAWIRPDADPATVLPSALTAMQIQPC